MLRNGCVSPSVLLILAACLFVFGSRIVSAEVLPVQAQETTPRVVTMEEFVQLATENDPAFEAILIDQLAINYRRGLLLPAGDIVMSVKSQYDVFLSQNREEPEVTASLSKLFPRTGTDVSVSYKNIPSATSTTSSSQWQLMLSQPIAENAFGKVTRLQDEIIGVENDVIRHQIVEAYEDYLAELMTVYYNWYSAYENLKVSEISYQQNLKLLDNIHERQRQKIALAVDVNKIKFLVLGKEENMISLRATFQSLTNIIKKSVRVNEEEQIIPADPRSYHAIDMEFEKAYEAFVRDSRTYQVLQLLEEQSTLEVAVDAQELLPSVDLLVGYRVDGDDWAVKNDRDLLFAGVQVDWPFPDEFGRASLETAQIALRKTQLTSTNIFLTLYANLRGLYWQIERERELIKIAEEKIRLAEAILEDEAENYSFGKITLNDYITAVNRVDDNRFNMIQHIVQAKKLWVEWLRLTDTIVTPSVLER